MQEISIDDMEVIEWMQKLRDAVPRESPGISVARTRGSDSAAVVELEHVFKSWSRTDDTIRNAVVKQFAQTPELADIPVLARMAKWEPDWTNRQGIVEAIAKSIGPGAVEVLTEIANDDPDEDVRASAIIELGKMARTTVQPTPASESVRSVRTRGAVRTRGV